MKVTITSVFDTTDERYEMEAQFKALEAQAALSDMAGLIRYRLKCAKDVSERERAHLEELRVCLEKGLVE